MHAMSKLHACHSLLLAPASLRCSFTLVSTVLKAEWWSLKKSSLWIAEAG